MKKLITVAEIGEYDRFRRMHLCNCLTGYKSPLLVGSISETGVQNLAIFSNVFHIGADPSMIGMIARPTSIPRDTVANIKCSKAYTLNHIPIANYEKGHLTSAKYPAEISEFEALNLKSSFIENFKAPFYADSPLKIGLSLSSMTSIPENDSLLIIGKVELIEVEEKTLLVTGHLDFSKLQTVASTGLDTYYSTEFIDRLPYAKYKVLVQSD